MLKRIAGSFIVILVLCFSMIPVVAAPVEIEPLWENTSQITLTLSFSNGRATANSIISGNSNTATISATYSLQERVGNSWVTVHTWSRVTENGRRLVFSNTAAATPGRTYRLTVNATVTNTAGVSENVTNSYEEIY